MATASHIISSSNLTFLPLHHNSSIFPHNNNNPSFLRLNSSSSTKNHSTKLTTTVNAVVAPSSNSAPSPVSSYTSSGKFYGLCYVVRDDVDTEQIIPASYYSALNPSSPDEYNDIGLHAFVGLPDSYALRFVEENGGESKYSVVIAGKNFGGGSSGDRAVVALNAARVKAVVAESYGGDFLRDLGSNEKIFGLECEVRICEEFKTGDVATIDVEERVLINQTTGKLFDLKPLANVDSSRGS